GSLQMADAALLVIDLADPSCIEQTQALHAILEDKRVTLTDLWSREESANGSDAQDVFAVRLPTLLLANKADAIADLPDQLAVLRELTGYRYPALPVSASTGEGLGNLGPWLFEHLSVVRVYTKTPGHPVDKHRPFTLRRGQTVADVAQLVHQDVARALRYARIWGKSGFDGQQVGPEHVLDDRDVVELHT